LIVATVYGAVKTADIAWMMGDLGVGMMAWLNIIAIWILHKPAIQALKDYELQKKQLGSGKKAIYKPDPKKVPNAVFWLKDYPQRLAKQKTDES
ncbi:sodium:alanine symporter, partial [Staphylococcus saprophyticus]